MEIKIKKIMNSRLAKIRSVGEIKEIQIKKNLQQPEKERIEVCFKGEHSSGIIELSKEEASNLTKMIQDKIKKKR
ncbi:MAG: hypothetical protein AABY10_00705 [Nanoarchaeota archaeon]